MKRPAPAALAAGLLVAFVSGVDLVRLIRLLPLVDPDPFWAIPRLVLGLAAVAGTAAAGGLAAGLFFLWASRFRSATADIKPFALSRRALALLAAAALAAGILLRFVALDRLPAPLWIDDLSLIQPALALHGTPADFSDSIRPAPFGVAKPYGSVGVLYLELVRIALRVFGTNVFGLRFPAAAAGAASVVTVFLLGRQLLPAGGGALAALVFAGLRWNLLVSRWGWNAVVLAPVVDVAAILLLRARRRRSAAAAAFAGAVAGLSAHLYLAAWAAAAGLVLLAAWPLPSPCAGGGRRPMARLPLAFVAGFAIFAAPIFLFHEGRVAPYFARASDHSVMREMGWTRSPMPALQAAADSLAAPWFKSDPSPHHDLPGRTRLGWLLGIPVAIALARALLYPGHEVSAYLLTTAAAGLAASVAGGHAGVPNGYRFGYLADATAVAAAAGWMVLAGLAPPPRRRAAALAAAGVVLLTGALGARDALVLWPRHPETFRGFYGQDTLLGRAALRWERYGAVTIEPGRAVWDITTDAIRRYRLDPDLPLDPPVAAAGSRRVFRIAAPDAPLSKDERAVERVKDAWGREWGMVVGRKGS